MLMFDEIVIEPSCGCERGALEEEMKELSSRYKCDVKAKFNGTVIHCKYIRIGRNDCERIMIEL